MALIACPECGREISDKVKVCPHCGYPLVEEPQQEQPKSSPQINAKRSKKLLIGVIATAVLIVTCVLAAIAVNRQNEAKARTAYISNLRLVRTTMLSGAADSESLCNLTKAVWRDTIYEEYHFDTSPFTQKNGKYNEDFNDSLAALYADADTLNTINEIKENQEAVAEIMRGLQNPPEDLAACSRTVEEMYDVYLDFTSLAISPSGSLQTYSENFSTYDNDFMRCYDKLDTQIPEE